MNPIRRTIALIAMVSLIPNLLTTGCATSRPAVLERTATNNAVTAMRQQGVALISRGNVRLSKAVSSGELLLDESISLSLIWATATADHLKSRGIETTTTKFPILWEPNRYSKNITVRDSRKSKKKKKISEPLLPNPKLKENPALMTALLDAQCLVDAAFEQYSGFTFNCSAVLTQSQKSLLTQYAAGSRYLLFTAAHASEKSAGIIAISATVDLFGQLGMGMLTSALFEDEPFAGRTMEQVLQQANAGNRPTVFGSELINRLPAAYLNQYIQHGRAALLDIDEGRVIWTGKTWKQDGSTGNNVACDGHASRYLSTGAVFQSLFCS